MKCLGLIFATTLALASLALASLALAQSAPTGIGFAQAEEGTWWCRDEKPEAALACALDKCRADAPGQECYPTRWCLPAGWSGMMTVWLPEFHSTNIVCGTSGEAALIATFEAFCNGSPFITRCTPFATIDPDGIERAIDDLDWPGPAIRAPDDVDSDPQEGSQ